MGQSTDAILAFGWDLGESGEHDWAESLYEVLEGDDSDSIDALYIEHSSFDVPPDPWDEIADKPEEWFYDRDAQRGWRVDSQEYKDWKQKNKAARDAYYEAKRAAVDDCPFEFIGHCSCDYPMHILGLRRFNLRARRSYPENVDLGALTHDWPKMDAEARAIATRLGLEPPEPPSLILASMWC